MALMQVPVTKGKGTVSIDTDAIPEEVYKEALLQGLKVLVNRGTSKITKTTYPVDEELRAAAMAKAEEQVADIMAGKVKTTGGKAKSGVTGKVKTEAMRLAKNLIKDEMKRAGIKISHVEASEITKAAKELLDDPTNGPGILALAEKNIAEREQVPTGIDVSKIKVSEKLAAKAAERNAERKASAPLSAKQAGKVAPRAKAKAPQAQPQA